MKNKLLLDKISQLLISFIVGIIMDKHVIEALGKARVTVQDAKVVDVEEPKIEYCPLFHKHRGIEKLTQEEIKKNIESFFAGDVRNRLV